MRSWAESYHFDTGTYAGRNEHNWRLNDTLDGSSRGERDPCRPPAHLAILPKCVRIATGWAYARRGLAFLSSGVRSLMGSEVRCMT